MEDDLVHEDVHRLVLHQHAGDDDAERHTKQSLPDDQVHRVDGRWPCRAKGHHPVDGCEAHRKEVNDDPNSAENIQPTIQLAREVIRAILDGGPLVRQIDDEDEQREIDKPANREAREVQVLPNQPQDVGLLLEVPIAGAETDRLNRHRRQWTKFVGDRFHDGCTGGCRQFGRNAGGC